MFGRRDGRNEMMLSAKFLPLMIRAQLDLCCSQAELLALRLSLCTDPEFYLQDSVAMLKLQDEPLQIIASQYISNHHNQMLNGSRTFK